MYYIDQNNKKKIEQWIINNTHKFEKPIRNKQFIKKSIILFNMIQSFMDSNNNRTPIKVRDIERKLRSEYFNYKDLLEHLYNLRLIYYSTTKTGKPHYGQRFYHINNFSESFCGTYCFDHQLIDAINFNDWSLMSIRNLKDQKNKHILKSNIQHSLISNIKDFLPLLLPAINNNIQSLLQQPFTKDVFPIWNVNTQISSLFKQSYPQLFNQSLSIIKSQYHFRPNQSLLYLPVHILFLELNPLLHNNNMLYNKQFVTYCSSTISNICNSNINNNIETINNTIQTYIQIYRVLKVLLNSTIKTIIDRDLLHNICPSFCEIENIKQGEVCILYQEMKKIIKVSDANYLICNIVQGKQYYDNKNYKELTLNGERICKELPHYGKYKDGRYYSTFHTKKREQRKHIKWDNKNIKQIYDISHCYPTLLVKLIQGKVNNKEEKEWKELVFAKDKDVYKEILKYSNIQVTKQNRDKIKPYVQKYINGLPRSIKGNLHNKGVGNNDPIYANAVYNFMNDNYPMIHQFIYNYSTITEFSFDINKFTITSRKVKNICHDLQKIQRQIIDLMTKELKNKDGIQSVTLFDGIYIKQGQEVSIDFDKILLEFFNYKVNDNKDKEQINEECSLLKEYLTMNLKEIIKKVSYDRRN